jgi:predicted Zn-ribbon and HTH transcriptional regulator
MHSTTLQTYGDFARGHLEHLDKSFRVRGERLVIEPATCIACGYAFARRSRIDPPAFRIDAG